MEVLPAPPISWPGSRSASQTGTVRAIPATPLTPWPALCWAEPPGGARDCERPPDPSPDWRHTGKTPWLGARALSAASQRWRLQRAAALFGSGAPLFEAANQAEPNQAAAEKRQRGRFRNQHTG